MVVILNVVMLLMVMICELRTQCYILKHKSADGIIYVYILLKFIGISAIMYQLLVKDFSVDISAWIALGVGFIGSNIFSEIILDIAYFMHGKRTKED